MIRILAIESSGPVCSAALFEDGESKAIRESHEVNSHAELLAVYCDELIKDFGKPDAISINTGPGSYTGLRIGVSLAKGMAYGFGIPVIGLSGLACMAQSLLKEFPDSDWIIPCIDARRMEVYQAVYDKKGISKEPVSPLIVETNSWEGIDGIKIVLGDGALKLQELLKDREDIKIIPGIFLSASYLLQESFRKFETQEFLDLAYFEPDYLKEFIALTSNKKKYVR